MTGLDSGVFYARIEPRPLSGARLSGARPLSGANLRQGLERNGPWHLLVEKDGTYEIALRRWPVEADAAITAGVPAFKAVDGQLPAGKALPITRARLKIATLDESKPVGPQAKAVTFTVALRAGTRLPMETWFYDAQGRALCGAYFAYVRRK